MLVIFFKTIKNETKSKYYNKIIVYDFKKNIKKS